MKEFKFKFIEWDGKPITKPGIYTKIPLETYHRHDICDGPSVSSSGLRRCLLHSPAHFYAEWPGNPNRVEPEDKPHFILGRAVHHLMLGEPFFAKLFAVRPLELPDDDGILKPWHSNRTVCRKWMAKTAKEGRAVLTHEDLVNIRGMAERLGQNPIVKAGALNGYIERSFFWRDEATGIWLKWRPDSVPNDSGDYVDLKTTTSVQWRDMQNAIYERGYFMQLGLGRMACRALKLPFASGSLIFVEKTNPWCERVVTLKDHELDRGERANRAALDAIAAGLKSGRWPGPGGDRDDAAHIELPEWAESVVDDRIERIS